MKRIGLIQTLVLLGFSTPYNFAADWPQWRGIHGNGVTAETGWNPALLKPSQVRWKTNIGFGHASLVTKGDRVYTFGTRAMKASESGVEDVVTCLDIPTGKIIWQFTYPSEDNDHRGPRATPFVDQGFIYTLSWNGMVYCLDAVTGQMKWKKDLIRAGLAVVPPWGFCGSPVIHGSYLLLNAGSLGLALDKKTGEPIWTSEAGVGTYTTPLLFDSSGRTLVGIPSGRAFWALQLETGKPEFWLPWYKDLDLEPVLVENRLFIGGYRSSMLMELSGKEHRILMENKKTRFSAYQNYVLVGDAVYGFAKSRDYPLMSVDLATGKVLWTQNLGRYGSLAAADGTLIITTGEGELIMARANRDGYRELAKLKVFDRKDHGEDIHIPWAGWVQPILANGHIFARNSYGDVVCVNVSTPMN